MSLQRKIRLGLLVGGFTIVSGMVLRSFAERLSREYRSPNAWLIDSGTMEMWRDISFVLLLLGLMVSALAFQRWLQVE